MSASDVRLVELNDWLAASLNTTDFTLARASEDASFRRYFRVSVGGTSRIAMDAPPAQEDCRPFVRIAGLMHEAGLHVPLVLAQNLDSGFLLLSDLGTTTYLAALENGNADALFDDALEALLKWQLASRPDVLPEYDEALLTREVQLFPDWYVARHLGRAFDAAEMAAWREAVAPVLRAALAQPRVYVHRDYMPRNLMVSAPNPGVLDFQDAVYGPVTYDVVSLFRDAFLTWEEERVIDWSARYWAKAKRAGLPVPADFGVFYRDFEWMGLQRHLKVLGIFARINYRDGKAHYLADTPRFVRYAQAVCARYSELAPLARLIDRLENRGATAAYGF